MITGNDMAAIDSLKCFPCNCFQIKNLGDLKCFFLVLRSLDSKVAFIFLSVNMH